MKALVPSSHPVSSPGKAAPAEHEQHYERWRKSSGPGGS